MNDSQKPTDLNTLLGLNDMPPPVDRTATTLIGGKDITEDHTELRKDGMQIDYVVLSDAERAKGYVRPLRVAYRHDTCGAVTSMNKEIAETYARDPEFYSGTFCCNCRAHFPIGPEGEFTWYNSTEKVGS